MLTAFQQERLATRPCGCGAAELDDHGNVRRVDSCSACLNNSLDFLRQVCYDPCVNEGRPGVLQLDMFPDSLPSSDLNGLGGSYGE